MWVAIVGILSTLESECSQNLSIIDEITHLIECAALMDVLRRYAERSAFRFVHKAQDIEKVPDGLFLQEFSR